MHLLIYKNIDSSQLSIPSFGHYETRFKHWPSLAFMATLTAKAYCLGGDFTYLGHCVSGSNPSTFVTEALLYCQYLSVSLPVYVYSTMKTRISSPIRQPRDSASIRTHRYQAKASSSRWRHLASFGEDNGAIVSASTGGCVRERDDCNGGVSAMRTHGEKGEWTNEHCGCQRVNTLVRRLRKLGEFVTMATTPIRSSKCGHGPTSLEMREDEGALSLVVRTMRECGSACGHACV